MSCHINVLSAILLLGVCISNFAVAKRAQLCLQPPEVTINDPELLCLGLTPTTIGNDYTSEPLRLVPTSTVVDWKRFNIPDENGFISLHDSDPPLCLTRDDDTIHVRFEECSLTTSQGWQIYTDGTIRPHPGTPPSDICMGVGACVDAAGSEVSPACPESQAVGITNGNPKNWAFIKMFACSDLEDKLPTNIYKFDIHEEVVSEGGPPTFSPTRAPTFDGQVIITDDTDAPTEVETDAPTEVETDAPTEAETDAPTEAETDAPTEAETDAPTEAETDAPTDAETDAPTEAETDAPTVKSSTRAPEIISNRTVELGNDTDRTFGGIPNQEVVDMVVQYTWVPVVALGSAIAISVLIGPVLVELFSSTSTTLQGNNPSSVVDTFEIVNLAQFVLLGAQLDLPAVPAHLYNFCLHFSWATLNIGSKREVNVDVRRLQNVGGFEEYSLAIGIDPGDLFENFLVVLGCGILLCTACAGCLWFLASLMSQGRDSSDSLDSRRASDSSADQAETTAAAEEVKGGTKLVGKTKSKHNKLQRVVRLAMVRVAHFTLYPVVLMSFFQLYYVSNLGIAQSERDMAYTIVASVLLFFVVAWVVNAHLRLRNINLSESKFGAELGMRQDDETAFVFLVHKWRPESKSFWVVRVAFLVFRAAIVIVLHLPRPVQPSLLLASSALYTIALLVVRPYPTDLMNSIAIFISCLYIPACIPLFIFAFESNSETGQLFSPALVQGLGTFQIILNSVLIFLTIVLVVIRWGPTLVTKLQICCGCCGSQGSENPSGKAVEESVQGDKLDLEQPARRRGLQAFSSQGQRYEEFAPTDNQVHGNDDEQISFTLTNA